MRLRRALLAPSTVPRVPRRAELLRGGPSSSATPSRARAGLTRRPYVAAPSRARDGAEEGRAPPRRAELLRGSGPPLRMAEGLSLLRDGAEVHLPHLT